MLPILKINTLPGFSEFIVAVHMLRATHGCARPAIMSGECEEIVTLLFAVVGETRGVLCSCTLRLPTVPHVYGFRPVSSRPLDLWGLTAPALLRELVANVAMGIPPIRRRRLKGLRTRHRQVGPEAAKIVAEFDFLRDSAGSLKDKTVVEIGPGDAIGLAPLFISAGAARYIALDRFMGDVWSSRARALYDQIASFRGPFQADWQSKVELLRVSIEQAGQTLPAADLLVSFDVIEHLADVPVAVRHMSGMLKPDGRMIHRVDYGPHGIWLSARDPLSFLRVPGWLWAAIGSNRGYPNRVRHPELVQLLRQQGLHVSDRITREQDRDVMDAEMVCGLDPTVALGKTFNLGGSDTPADFGG
jgi:SAM-dependent methyltransferase